MKNLRMSLASLMLALALVFGGSNVAKAQTSSDVVNTGVSLLNLVVVTGDVVTIGDVNVDISDNNVEILNITNSLNNNDIAILNDILNNLTIDNVLNNLLREADIISNNQIVVGILSDGTFLILDQKANTKPRKK